jgi:glycosyltransferase involved in cell wall biosynthesis
MDAMSFELPVVSIDAWANGEIVEDGRTGMLTPRSKHIPYYYGASWHCNFGARAFRTAIRKTDPVVVSDLANKVAFLIEHPDLRHQMGRAGRWEIENGRLSIANRNGKLRRLFDGAIADAPGDATSSAQMSHVR